MPGALQAGADHHDAGRNPARGPPEGGGIDRRHRLALGSRRAALGSRGHRAAFDDRRPDFPANATTTPATAQAETPYRNHLPVAESVITTLPPGVAMARTNDAANHPTAGIRPAVGVCIPQAARTQVAKIAAANVSAAADTGPRVPL